MSNWQRTLNLVDVWKQATAQEVTAQQVATTIANRLEALKDFDNGYVDNIKFELVESFQDFASDESADFDDLDYLLEELYNWADISLDNKFGGKKVCWVKTF